MPGDQETDAAALRVAVAAVEWIKAGHPYSESGQRLLRLARMYWSERDDAHSARGVVAASTQVVHDIGAAQATNDIARTSAASNVKDAASSRDRP
jgi:hypothetical protein